MSNSIVVYHGSNVKISKFTLDKLKSGQGTNDWGIGIYFTTNPDLASKHGKFVHVVTITQEDTIKVWEDVASKDFLIYTLKRLVNSNKISDDDAKGFLQEINGGAEIGYLDFMNYLEGLVGTEETIRVFTDFGINGLKVPSYGSDDGVFYAIANPNIITIDKVVPNRKQESLDSIRKSLRALLIEGLDDSWSDGGKTVTLRQLLRITKDVPVQDVATSELVSKVLSLDGEDEVDKIENSDLQYPILVLLNDDESIRTIIDGNHRVQKSIKNNLPTVKAKLIKFNSLPDNFKDVLG